MGFAEALIEIRHGTNTRLNFICGTIPLRKLSGMCIASNTPVITTGQKPKGHTTCRFESYLQPLPERIQSTKVLISLSVFRRFIKAIYFCH
jgi:cAMP phosphodiesterase